MTTIQVPRVHNPVNREITLNDVQSILIRYGICPKAAITNVDLYRRAFVHRSYMKTETGLDECPPNCVPLKTKCNERLEFLGDGVLELVTKYYLYRRFPQAEEGFMTDKKIAIVKNVSIGRIAQCIGLHQWFLISASLEERNCRNHLETLGALFESFIGALFLNGNQTSIEDDETWMPGKWITGPGFQMAQRFIENVLETHIDWTHLVQFDDNYKNALQVKLQKQFKVTPHYLEMEHKDNGYHMGVYLCLGQTIYETHWSKAITIHDLEKNTSFYDAVQHYVEIHKSVLLFLGEGTHRIKRKAEQMACEMALKSL